MPITTQTGDGVWYFWNNTTTGTSTGGDLIWNQWVTNSTTTASVYTNLNDAVWGHWNTGAYIINAPNVQGPPPLETAEQRAERQRQADENRARYLREQEEAREEQRRAIATAEELLLSLLDETQAQTRRERGYFDVVGSDGFTYRINHGTSGNVQLLGEDGERLATYCAHPRGYLPEADVHVAQMLTLMADADHFIDTANVHFAARDFDPRRRVARELQPEALAA